MQRLHARRLLTRDGVIEYPEIAIDEGVITELTAGDPSDSTENWAAPFFDIHVHGAVMVDFMAASGAEFDQAGRFLARRGTAFYLATTVTDELERTLSALDRIARRIGATPVHDAATPVGIHLEGPFLCAAKRGVHPLGLIVAPSIELFDRMQHAARGHIRLMTLAPEMPGALDLIRHAVAQNVRVSLGHSNATFAEAVRAIAAGAVSATHIFNAMCAIDHREPGLAIAVLDSPALYAEAIVDGIHVHPAMVRTWLRLKNNGRAILITDGISATGMPDGRYKLGSLDVEVAGGVCRSDGALAGSVLTLDHAVMTLREMTGATLATAVSLASHNPAEMMGLAPLTEVRVGGRANWNIYSADGLRLGSMLNGVRLDT